MPTRNQSCRIFPGGDQVPYTPSSTDTLVPGSSDIVRASYQIPYQPSGNPPPPAITYQFIFWSIDGTPYQVQETFGTPDDPQVVTYDAPDDDSTYDATAWYVQLSIGGPGGEVFAFSLNEDEKLSNSAIGTITPASAQTGPDTFTTTDPVVVTAPAVIGGYGRFTRWLQYSGNGDPHGQVLSVPASGSTASIAFYGIPVPDPCREIRDQLASLSPGDFQTLHEYEEARSYFLSQLHACEKEYGE